MGSPFTQLAKSLIFCRSASEQLLLLSAETQTFLSKGTESWPQAETFPLRLDRAFATLSHVEDGELLLPHPTAPNSSTVHPSTIRRIRVPPL